MTHSKVSRIARRAIPAFVVAGLGLTLQAAPALAVPETPTAMATEDQPTSTEQGAVTGVTVDGDREAHKTLQEALGKGYSEVLVNKNLTECISITGDEPSDPADPEPSQFNDTIELNGHTLKSSIEAKPAISNNGKLVIRNTSQGETNPDAAAIKSYAESVSGPAITNDPGSELELYDIDVTGTIENSGNLNIYGGKYKGTINNNEADGGTLYIHGGNFTEATINYESYSGNFVIMGGTFPASWKHYEFTSNLDPNSCAKQNEDFSWTVFRYGNDAPKLTPGTYYLNNASSTVIHDDDIQEGCRVIYSSYNSIEVVKDDFEDSTVCHIKSEDGSITQYDSFEKALKNAKSRDYIYLDKDIKTDKAIVVPYGVSIEGNFHSITLTADIDSEAFITVDGNSPADGPASGCHFIRLTVDAGKHCSAAMLIDDSDEYVDVSYSNLKGGEAYGAIVDSSFITFSNTDIYPGEGARAAINYRKHGTGWVRLATLNCRWSGSQAGVYIEPDDLLDIMADANAEGAVLSTPQQAVCWLDAKDIIHPGIYYWPDDQHAEDRRPSEIDESVTVKPADHGTAESTTCKKDETATLTVKPDDGYRVGTISILGMNGNEVDYNAGSDGTFTYMMPYGGVTIAVTFVDNSYTPIDPTPTPDPDPEPEPDPDQDVEVPETEGGAVEVAPVPTGETATVVAKPDAGQEVREVIVTDSEGNEVETSIDEDGNVTFEMPEGGATVEVVFGCDGGDLCVAHKFSDVTHDDWFHDTVDWALDNGIFHGYNDTSFAPNDTLTREQAATVMYNYFGGAAGSPGSGLPDVEGDEWYTDAVNWAVENGIMTGYSDSGEFGIGDGLSREQFCTVIVKAMGADLSDVDLSVLDRFTDADSVSDWAKPAVAWAVQNGLMNGVENPDGTRSLQGIRDMTRAEMATMMKNAVDAGVLTK